MKMIGFILVAMAAGPAVSQGGCFQTFQVATDRLVPELNIDAIVADIGGRTCGAVEDERTMIYIDQLAGVSDASFDSFGAWEAANESLTVTIQETRADLADAIANGASDERWNYIKTAAVTATSAGITLAGCLGTPFTFGVSSVACAGGWALTGYGAYDGLTGNDFQARADEINTKLGDLEEILASQKAVGAAILPELQQNYLDRFAQLCSAVETFCL